jgi:aminoglycoside phosphotransferase (APT) family kinase protein
MKLPEKTLKERYILRIPWTDHIAWLEHEVAMIAYLREHISLPVADIVDFDLSYNNSIGRRYTLQARIAGETVTTAYPKINTAQRVCFARQLGEVLQQMGRKSYRFPGVLDPDSMFQDV